RGKDCLRSKVVPSLRLLNFPHELARAGAALLLGIGPRHCSRACLPPRFCCARLPSAIPHATVYAAFLFPILAIAEFFGVFKLVRGCVARPFDLLTFLSFGALFVL